MNRRGSASFEIAGKGIKSMIPEEVIEAVDAIVPAGVSHIGFVATNIAREFLLTEPQGHPYGVSATFSKVKVKVGERPS